MTNRRFVRNKYWLTIIDVSIVSIIHNYRNYWFLDYCNCHNHIRPAPSSNTVWSNHDTLQWRHDGRYGVSNHQPRDCLLNRFLRRRSKKTSKLRITGLLAGNSPVTDKFPAQSQVTRKMFPFDDVIMVDVLQIGHTRHIVIAMHPLFQKPCYHF